MSRELNEVRRLFEQRLKEAADSVAYGTIQDVDEDARTCNVKVGGVTYEGVLLYAIENAELKGPAIIPKKNSGVLVSRIGSSSRRYVEMFSEIDKVVLTIADNIELAVDADGLKLVADKATLQAGTAGFKMTRGGAGLKKTLGDLCDAIGQLTVPTGTGPSGTPINIASFTQIKQGLNDYLED